MEKEEVVLISEYIFKEVCEMNKSKPKGKKINFWYSSILNETSLVFEDKSIIIKIKELNEMIEFIKLKNSIKKNKDEGLVFFESLLRISIEKKLNFYYSPYMAEVLLSKLDDFNQWTIYEEFSFVDRNEEGLERVLQYEHKKSNL